MATYTPTTWVNGSAPGISAANLNNMETGIDDACDHTVDVANPHQVTGEIVFSLPGKGWVHSGRGRYKLLHAVTIIDVVLTAGTAPTGADGVFDLHKDGTTLFTTQTARPKVLAGSQDGSSTTPAVTACAAGTVLIADCDQVGSTEPGRDWTLTVRYRETD